MSRLRSIPEELIKIKAHQFWEKRQREGRDGTPESDWIEAKKYLEKHQWKVFWWEVRNPGSRDFALEIVKTFLEIVKTLGIGLTAFGLVFSVIKGIQEHRLTQERLDLDKLDREQNRILIEERLVTERFSKAVEQLGNEDNITVRIGGIYALERIAKDSDKDHWTIIEVLTNYVRENSLRTQELKNLIKKRQDLEDSRNKGEINNDVFKQKIHKLRDLAEVSKDVQVVLTVIGRRKDPKPDRDEKINLSSTNLIGANLKGANLKGADLWGAYLWLAYLIGADLKEADLKEADLKSAPLIGADLEGADLIGANLWGAYLKGAYLEKAKFTNQQIKSACNWEQAIYKGERNDEKETWVAIEPDNTNFIEELKEETASNSKERPNCSN